MKTAEIKNFIVNDLMKMPDWNDAFVERCENDKSKQFMFNTKYWHRNRKWKFSNWKEFVKKQYGDEPDYEIDPTDMLVSDVEPYGNYPDDNKQYVCREFTFTADEVMIDDFGEDEDFTCPDVSMYVITDSTDTKIVCVTATAD